MSINVNPSKGMRDFMPEEKEIRDYIEKIIVDTYKKDGFQLIETPVVENIERLLGSEGGDNLRLIYRILKRGKKLKKALNKEPVDVDDLTDLGLRYDLTVPLSRFYCNSRADLPMVFKAMQVGNVFRAERAQKGRYRSFKQCDIDIIGDETKMAEIQLISSTAKALTKLNVTDFVVRINDRRILKDVVLNCGFKEENFENVCITLDKLDKIGLDGIKKELTKKEYGESRVKKILDAMAEINNKGLEVLPKYGVSEKIIKEIETVINSINDIREENYEIIFDFTLVRGMGYYTGSIFEISYKNLGYSIAGGGRYDEMIGNFIGEKIPAIGFSIGFERLANQLIKEKFKVPGDEKLVMLYDENDNFSSVINAADKFRDKGYIVGLYERRNKMGKQLNRLFEQGYGKFTIFSEIEEEMEISELNED
ncbi:MAG: histidine--tRNA ligase [Bacillota bacterium]|nr:histidine--tRNA ligase [Bacillota bacterium]